MTSLPAQRIGLPQKGNLAPGSDGDVVIFDPETIRDTATFQDPDRTPEGIDYVLLGGEIACDHGTLVRGNLGKALRRT
jgi:N-acyl-D-amino-acid deacylase